MFTKGLIGKTEVMLKVTSLKNDNRVIFQFLKPDMG